MEKRRSVPIDIPGRFILERSLQDMKYATIAIIQLVCGLIIFLWALIWIICEMPSLKADLKLENTQGELVSHGSKLKLSGRNMFRGKIPSKISLINLGLAKALSKVFCSLKIGKAIFIPKSK